MVSFKAQTQNKLKDSLLQLTLSAREDQFTIYWRNLWRATLKPSAGPKVARGPRVGPGIYLKGIANYHC